LFYGQSELPWLLPGVVVFAVVGAALGRRLARPLAAPPFVSCLLIVSLGIVLSATLTPLRGTPETAAISQMTCDLSTLAIAPLGWLVSANDRSLNILLFIPLGVSLGLFPRSRHTAVLVLAALVLPFAIEATQLLVPILGRGCESADVIDNLIGLIVGLVSGAVAGQLLTTRATRRATNEEPNTS